MAILSFILGCVLFFGIALVPTLLMAKLMGAVFSSELREQMGERWVFHLFWSAAAILIVVGFVTPGSGRDLPKARKVKTETEIDSIQTAIISYKTEYLVPPEGKDNASLIKILMGGNSRGIEFLALKKSDIDDKGAVLDSWGTPFHIDMTDPQHPKIQSAGPDRKWGTADDLTRSVDSNGAK